MTRSGHSRIKLMVLGLACLGEYVLIGIEDKIPVYITKVLAEQQLSRILNNNLIKSLKKPDIF